MAKRSEVNSILKEHGLQNLRYSTGDVLRQRGKMVRAIPVASHSPLDVTSIATDRAAQRFRTLVSELEINLCFDLLERSQRSATLSAGKTVVELRLEEFPSYPLSRGMDPGYTQTAIVVEYRN